MPSWLADFEIKNRVIHVKSTGAELPLNFVIVREVLNWMPFYLIERIKGFFRNPLQQDRLNVSFTPTVPRPWYMLSVAVHRANMRITKNLTQADAIIYFEDKTTAKAPKIPENMQVKALNFACTDITKSHVAKVFEQVFGYALTLNPETYSGEIAVKSEKNGAHDGYVAQGPCAREDGMVYQRLIDNAVDGKWVEDLRCPVVGGEIRIVFIKQRPLTKRFANTNTNVTLHSPNDLLSLEEQSNIKRFTQKMGLDWGGIDVLRNKQDGKIYIVDVNKTDMGPPIALSLKDKNTATTILTAQLVALIKSRT